MDFAAAEPSPALRIYGTSAILKFTRKVDATGFTEVFEFREQQQQDRQALDGEHGDAPADLPGSVLICFESVQIPPRPFARALGAPPPEERPDEGVRPRAGVPIPVAPATPSRDGGPVPVPPATPPRAARVPKREARSATSSTLSTPVKVAEGSIGKQRSS